MATQVIILAAGQGTRLRPLTDDKPKCLVPFLGKSLLEHQLAALNEAGIANADITVATGYRADAIGNLDLGVALSHNEKFATTNMVESMLAARSVLESGDDVLALYADLVYQPEIVGALMASATPFATCVDLDWQKLWAVRNEDPIHDAETLKLDDAGNIRELGKKPSSLADIEGQYMGMTKFSAAFATEMLKHHDALDPEGLYDGKNRANMFMTSLLQQLIDAGHSLRAVTVHGGWLEVDTTGDLALYERLAKEGKLSATWQIS